jgi:hypothetical protein
MAHCHRCAITSLDASQAAHAQLAARIRSHWQIEVLHHIRSLGASSLSHDVAPEASRRAFATPPGALVVAAGLTLLVSKRDA